MNGCFGQFDLLTVAASRAGQISAGESFAFVSLWLEVFLVNPHPSQSALREVIAEAYRAFEHHAAPPFPLDVCLACCVSVEIEQQLRSWPLTRLTADHFHEYNCSAKSEVQPAQEIGHLLPRMLELLAKGEEIHHSIELSLDRLGRCPEDCWSEDERAVLNRFALAYFACVLRDDPAGDSACRGVDDPFSVLLMFNIGGIAIEPLLDLWLDCDAPSSTAQFVEGTYWDFWEHREYGNAFASDRPEFRARIRAWLLAPDHRKRFAERLMAPEFQELASAHGPVGRMPFSLMVDGVFDQLMSPE